MSEQQQAQQPQTAPRQPAVLQPGPDGPPWWINLVTDRLDAKLEALKSHLEGEIKAVESRLDAKLEALKSHLEGGIKAVESRLESKIQASETRQSEARASQTWRIIAAVIGVQGLFFTLYLVALRFWPTGGGG